MRNSIIFNLYKLKPLISVSNKKRQLKTYFNLLENLIGNFNNQELFHTIYSHTPQLLEVLVLQIVYFNSILPKYIQYGVSTTSGTQFVATRLNAYLCPYFHTCSVFIVLVRYSIR